MSSLEEYRRKVQAYSGRQVMPEEVITHYHSGAPPNQAALSIRRKELTRKKLARRKSKKL